LSSSSSNTIGRPVAGAAGELSDFDEIGLVADIN
jgi:hypothetical protein